MYLTGDLTSANYLDLTGEKLGLRRLHRKVRADLPVRAGDLRVVDKVGGDADAENAASLQARVGLTLRSSAQARTSSATDTCSRVSRTNV